MKNPPNSIFFNTFEERVALARQRYFEEGRAPSGLVGGNVFESWLRCERQGIKPHDTPEFNEVTKSRAELAKQRNHQLLLAWSSRASELERTLAGTACSAVLTDATGVVIACLGMHDINARTTRNAHRIGVNLSEEAVGTTAPALAIKAGAAVIVKGGEHFFNKISHMHCAAAPIRNASGKIAGILNIAREGGPFTFEASALVSMYAASIENKYLTSAHTDQIVITLQLNPSLLDTPYAGMIGCKDDGTVVWQNQVAIQLLGQKTVSGNLSKNAEITNYFAQPLAILLSIANEKPTPVRLISGLSVWIKITHPEAGLSGATISTQASGVQHQQIQKRSEKIPTQDNFSGNTLEKSTEIHHYPEIKKALSGSLKECDTDIVVSTVQRFKGNISQAAKSLQVSRGLIYRHLSKLTQKPE